MAQIGGLSVQQDPRYKSTPTPANRQGIGNQIGDFLGFDPTPGFNIRNPFNSNPQSTAPAAKPKPKNETASPSQPQVAGASTTDPYARFGGQARYNTLTSGFDAQKQNIFGTAREGAQNQALGRQSSILDYIQGLQSGQRAIDERGVQNELALRQGRGSVLDMVGRGVRQGGTMLAQKNATDSSAAEGLARAYGDMGQRQMSTLGNQYELENRDIGLQQAEFDQQRATGLRKFDENKVQAVNSIVADAQSRLAQLDAAMVDADMPTRIQMEQEKNAIKQEAMGILSQFDQQLSQGAAGVQATGVDDRRRTAADLATRGVAAANPFDFTASAPAQFQNSGPFASELPLFMLPRQRQEV